MRELWVPLSGAIAQQRKVETIANNIANVNTPGFKKDSLVFKEHLAAFQAGNQDIDLPNKEWRPKDFYKSYGAENSYVKVDNSYTQFTQGDLVTTGNSLDLAIRGSGFIEVLSPQGIRYTRKGNLSVSNKGQLVTDKGDLVLSPINTENPLPPEQRAITLSNSPVTINLQGKLFQDGVQTTEISVVEFKNPHLLQKEGNSLFINKFDENILEPGKRQSQVFQGSIEQSNVNALGEMAELIKANRRFESIQRVIKAYDSITSKGVNEIAKF